MEDLPHPEDEFNVANILFQYQCADAGNRIRLLQELTKNGRIPFRVALTAAQDEHTEVRCWIALNGQLDYREFQEDPAGHISAKYSDRNLAVPLLADRDPFVRASIYANPYFHPLLLGLYHASEIRAIFERASYIERLGMLRNSALWVHFLTAIANLDSGLSLSIVERKNLLEQFLSANLDVEAGTLTNSTMEALREHDDNFRSIMNSLWQFISQWPEENGIQSLVYRFVPAFDETVANIFRATRDPGRRLAILSMVWNERNNRLPYQLGYGSTLEAGMVDEDATCRLLAHALCYFGRYGRLRVARWKELWRVWQRVRNDPHALAGLARNSSLGPIELRWVRSQARTLHQKLWQTAQPEIRRLLSEMHRDVELTLSEVRIEKRRGKMRRSTDEPKVAWSEDEKLDFIAEGLMSDSMWQLFVQGIGVASAIGLILGTTAFLISRSLAPSLLLFFGCSWLGGLAAYLALQNTIFVPPWRTTDEWKERTRRLWSRQSAKAPLSRNDRDDI